MFTPAYARCGAAGDDLKYLYEGDAAFAALPTYAIIAAHPSLKLVPLEQYIPGGIDRVSQLTATWCEWLARVSRGRCLPAWCSFAKAARSLPIPGCVRARVRA